MTDEELIKLLKNIKEHCNENICGFCEFYSKDKTQQGKCQIRKLASELNYCPEIWDIEKIERIIKQ